MNTDEKLKKIVREKYGEIAEQSLATSSCCGPSSTSCCGTEDDFTAFSLDYSDLEGYNPDADLDHGLHVRAQTAFGA